MESTPPSSSAPQGSNGPGLSSVLNDIKALGQTYLVDKAPALPEGVREFLVKIAPYLAIIGVAFGVLGLITLLGIGTFGIAVAGLALYGYHFFVGLAALVAMLILQAMAIPGLFHRREAAWNLMLYATLVQALENLLTMNVLGLVVGTLISSYLLFQVRSYFTAK